MADDDARRQPVPVVPRPAELVHERSQEQGGVGHAAGDHDLGAGVERLHDRAGPEVGTGEQGVVGQVQLGGPRPHVVTDDRCDLHPTHAQGSSGPHYRPPGGHRIDAPGVGDEAGPPVEHVRHGLLEIQRQVTRVAQ